MDDTRREIYKRTRDDLLKRSLSNTENYDRSVLTLSSAALGLSLTFIKNVVHFDNVCSQWLLITSWSLFVLAIIVTLVSFLLSQYAIKTQLKHAEKYYLQGNEEFLNRRNFPATLTDISAYVSAGAFVVAIIALVTFISLNIG